MDRERETERDQPSQRQYEEGELEQGDEMTRREKKEGQEGGREAVLAVATSVHSTQNSNSDQSLSSSSQVIAVGEREIETGRRIWGD